MENRIFNFSAGPAILPEEVLIEAKNSLLNYQNTGIGIMEMSHRSNEYKLIVEEAKSNLKKILNLNDEFDILFLHGGASLQFHMLPLNMAANHGSTSYINTGVWSKKAIKEAQRLSNVQIIATSEDKNFNYIPQINSESINSDSAYVHFTSNNTIYGTQFQKEPDTNNILLACDASSDFLSKKINMDKYGIIYAGAQKNLGPAGISVVVIKKDWLNKSDENLPPMLSYLNHSKNGSMFNTPPAFALYVVGLVFKWIVNTGGLEAIEKINKEKAQILYGILDNSQFYFPQAEQNSRSLMNVTFRLKTEELEQRFISQALKEGFSGLKGHRLVGGIRASIYNAFPKKGVEALVEFMKTFEINNK